MAVSFNVSNDVLVMQYGGLELSVSLHAPQFTFSVTEQPVGGSEPSHIKGDIKNEHTLLVTYAPETLPNGAVLDVVLHIAWSEEEAVLRKWAECTLSSLDTSVQIEEVIFDTFDSMLLQAPFVVSAPRSIPAFFDGFFVGIEFPVAATRIENNQLILGHAPFVEIQPDLPYQTRKAVYGFAKEGDTRRAFHQYIEYHRPQPKGLHFNYNSWWTSPVPFSEDDILGLMKIFEENLYQTHGVGFDTFTIDLGWSDAKSIWEIDKKLFPEGFTHIQSGAERMGGHLGLWVSPSSFYGQALDTGWADEAGYEAFAIPWGASEYRILSLGGERYATAFRERLASHVERFDIRQVKLDGFFFGFDHMAGPYSAEETVDGAIAAFTSMREANPNVWLECTFDANASPWWLFHINSVIGMFGDDSPPGRVPCPVFRESYTTSRDFYNLQGADWLMSPIAAQEILGIIHQSEDDFMNDAVVTVLRGHAFLPMYINPKYMDDLRWRALADTLKWARNNEALLVGKETLPLRQLSWPADISKPHLPHETIMPREPYGYAHWDGSSGLILLRNPWIIPQSYTLQLGVNTDNPDSVVSVVSVYPEPRIYGRELSQKDFIEIPLAPYETVVLSVAPDLLVSDIPGVEESIGTHIQVSHLTSEVKGTRFEETTERMGPDWTHVAGTADTMVELQIHAEVQILSPQNRIMLLLEGMDSVPGGKGMIKVNGMSIPMRVNASSAGFTSTGIPAPEYWTFLEADLQPGKHTIELDASFDGACTLFSVWIWGTREGGESVSYLNALPEPEIISLDAKALLLPTKTETIDFITHTTIPKEYIDGIYLDALEPISVTQGWGQLQYNQSVWERPMTIGSKSFLRGLGTHAESRIVYNLDALYSRFEAWIGPDSANNGTIVFSIMVDGETRFDSGLMTRADEARHVEVDITGASELVLLVDDGGDGNTGDHANWADAKLLR